MLAGLVVQELWRVGLRRRVWVVWLAFAAIGLAWMRLNRGTVFVLPGGRVTPTAPMLAVGAIDALAGAVLFSPLIMGGTLAEDRATGLAVLLLARCRSRSAWVTSKIAASLALSLAAYGVLGACLAGIAAAMGPWDTSLLAQTVGVRAGEIGSHPLLLIAVACTLLALASAATVAWSTAMGFLVRSPVLALIVPVIALFAASLVLPASVNPYVRATFLGSFFSWNTLEGTAAYWITLLIGGWFTALFLGRSREE